MGLFPNEEIDPHFLKSLAQAAGVELGEFAFERRGTGDTTYPLHGVILAVDTEAGTITLRRTRTHAGEVHQMGLRYFLTATTPQGHQWKNRVLVDRNRQFREQQQAREKAVAAVLASTHLRCQVRPTRSVLSGMVEVELDGKALTGYRYFDLEHPGSKVVITATSLTAAQQFIGMQDIFVPLDDMLWDAVNGRVLWPAGIQCDRVSNREAWSTDWLTLYDVLQVLSPSLLLLYVNTMRTGYEFPHLTKFTDADLHALQLRGLIRYEAPPQTSREVLEKVPSVAGLRKLIKEHGITAPGMARAQLIERMLTHETPALIEAARRLIRPPRAQFLAPCGLSKQEFLTALSELRHSIFRMRQWLRGTEDRFRDFEEEILRASA